MALEAGGKAAIHDQDLARLAVELKEHEPLPFRLRVADRDKLDDERLPGFDFDTDFLARFHAVEEHRGRQHAGVRVALHVSVVVGENARVKQVRDDFLFGHRPLNLLLELLPRSGEVSGWKMSART